MTFDEFYELNGSDRESGLQGIALAFEVSSLWSRPMILIFLSEFR